MVRKTFNTNTLQLLFEGEYFLIGDTVRVEFKGGETIVGSVVNIERLPKNFQRLEIIIEESLVLRHIGTAYEQS